MNNRQLHGLLGLAVFICLLIGGALNLVALSHGIVDKVLIAFFFSMLLAFIILGGT